MDASTTARHTRALGRAVVVAIALALTVTSCSSSGSGSGDVAKNVVPTQDAEDNNPQPLDKIKDGGELREPLQQWITQWNPYQVDGRYGDAVEATKGKGVAWLAPNGELLGVEFDDVTWDEDDQVLELPNDDLVRVKVRRGRTSVRAKRRPRRPNAA